MPDWKHVIRERLQGLKLDGARESEIVDELAQHLEDRYDALRSAGAPPPEARRQTLEELNRQRIVGRGTAQAPPARAPEPIGLPTHGDHTSPDSSAM